MARPVTWTPTPEGVELRTPYSDQFRKAMRALPIDEREWDPAKYCWIVSWDYASKALDAMLDCFNERD